MRYLGSAIKQRLLFGPGGVHPDKFAVYTDANWATDKSDRKSISGGAFLYYGEPISWSSKKQTSVTTSSAKAEYISEAMYAKQGQWIAQIHRDMRVHQIIHENATTVQMYGDSQDALALVKDPYLHERWKHVDICYRFVRNFAKKKRLTIDYVPTIDMVADGMTKPLERVGFERFKKQFGLVDGPRLWGLP
ncbi:hypothetical protein K3495_g12524 [Podosphaera aphanis]|nr:hypothetical protein K3495_g12524 [Podosphaera aphanis]